MCDRPPVRFILTPLASRKEHVGDLIVRSLLPRSRKLAPQIAAGDVVSDKACRVAIGREIFPRNPASQTGLTDPRELIFTLFAGVGPDLSLQPDEMPEKFVITTPRQVNCGRLALQFVKAIALEVAAAECFPDFRGDVANERFDLLCVGAVGGSHRIRGRK